jgi:hypothetical protein
MLEIRAKRRKRSIAAQWAASAARASFRRRMSTLRFSLAATIALLAIAAPARADDLGDPYLGVELMLGFSGDMDVESDGVRIGGAGITVSDGAKVDFAPELGIGGGVIYMHPLLKYFALGGRFAVQSWSSDREGRGGRNLAFELAAVPQVRLPLSAAVELYLSVPIGITLDLLNELDESFNLNIPGINAGASLDADAGVGWNVAGLLGVRFAVAAGFGLFAEVGYAMHQVSHDVRFQLGVGGASQEAVADLDVTWSQVALDVGVYF